MVETAVCRSQLPILHHPMAKFKLLLPMGEATFRRERAGDESRARWLVVLPATGSDGNVAEGPTGGPVALAALAEVPWLANIVVVEVTKLGFHAFAPGAWYDFVCRPLFCGLILII